ncbi:hypothetical protein BD324DRAFT_613723 [Kockovaella imperatae]|uniref:SGNH hydrolase-type esterase domain-containing protein n=1 Tax=Kockovaella imperatae TaxID=4999 RepID=A0A1Y1UUS8_9TREE|nr:hypothetical protein BD324DRAFT_613723 [Kockovaella imperatae]ORX41226.1 hypothetical protein BD324DRAFT_613723 [Kockovaella imperatae]
MFSSTRSGRMSPPASDSSRTRKYRQPGKMVPGRLTRSRILTFLTVCLLSICLIPSLRCAIGINAGSDSCSDSPSKMAKDLFRSNHASSARACGICDVAPAMCEEYGVAGMRRAMSYMGSGDRVQRFIVKAKQGKGFNVGVLGGSVSKGFGLDWTNTDNLHTHTNMHRVIFDHLDSLYPAPNGMVNGTSGRSEGKNGFVNGALGGTGTDYFSMCYKEHIPDDVDLVLLELAINDQLLLRNINSYEQLVRALMELPEVPAIINIQIFALMFPEIAQGGEMHAGVSQYYDLPVVSFRNLLLPTILRDNTLLRKWFSRRSDKEEENYGEVDLRHVNKRGHRLAGDLVKAYLDTQICEVENLEKQRGYLSLDDFPVQPLPRLLIGKKFDLEETVPKLDPVCYSTRSEKSPLAPQVNTGWREWSWQEKKYLVADVPGATMKLDFFTRIGRLEVFYLRSKAYGLGTADCWVDDDRQHAKRMEGWWDLPYNIGRTELIAEGLSEGKHVLTCELRPETKDPGGGLEFRLISVNSV